ncbi:metal-dependent hydrolase [Alteromonas sp. ASW11-36]|uniref:Metal-dependent hydrolase n=1 Tax=Alteromonas arenosi TaxID=3055817 RepID=A0ABT7SYA3_9ALTE|nr:metal-dependent hydrolase [Alteromonas sp. ASW11-36]MDM7860989.1 metal-dependent hydrolase [Alteromonas sp. ASW11-36]
MDSVSQLVLGSAVGYAVLGRKMGVKAAVYGAAFGTLPDLDVFLSYGDPVKDFTYHRSFTHSIVMQLLIAPAFAWGLQKLHKLRETTFNEWFWLVFAVLSTHAILDSFTVYGTQLLWPFTEYPFGISSLFIIDPAYTLPLLFSFIVVLLPPLNPARKRSINHYALAISCGYMLWSLAAKWHIDGLVDDALTKRGIDNSLSVSTPAPFNTFLWRSVVVEQNHYYEIYASVFDSVDDVSIYQYQTQPELIAPLQDEWHVQRLQWFTKGLYAVRAEGNNVHITDLRMGIEGSYVFDFVVGEQKALAVIPSAPEQKAVRPDINQAGLLWDRILDPNVDLSRCAREQLC